MLAAFGAWILKIASSKLVAEIFERLSRSDEGQAKVAEIQTKAAVALKQEETSQLATHIAAANERQMRKMNMPVFWIVIMLMMGPPVLILWGVAIYNILWWEHGIWPQPWAIADFPPSLKPWVQKSIDWLYDPLSVPTSIGAAAGAGLLAGRKR